MQTWMTRISFLDTAEDLDRDQAALQFEEGQALFYELMYGNVEGVDGNHPILNAWRGYETALGVYTCCMALRLVKDGISVGLQNLEISNTIETFRKNGDSMDFVVPPWLSDTDVLTSHRSNLQRRWPSTYRQTWRGVPADMPYLWPFVDDEGGYQIMLSKHDKELLASGERTLPKSILKKVANA